MHQSLRDPLVTVVIPTRDRAMLTIRAVETVLGQTYQNLEIVVVDDGSSDGIFSLIERRFGGRVRVARNGATSGPASARNRGISLARGDYIAFLDSDDVWLPEKIAKQVQLAEDGADVVYCHAAIVTLTGRVQNVVKARARGHIVDDLLRENAVAGSASAVLLRRACVDFAAFRDGALLEDWDLWLRLAFHFRFNFVPEVLVRVTLEPGSRNESLTPDAFVDGLRSVFDNLSASPLTRDAVQARRRQIDATLDYFMGWHLNKFGRRREAAEFLVRSALRDPLQLRAWRALATIAAGAHVTAAARQMRSRLLSQWLKS